MEEFKTDGEMVVQHEGQRIRTKQEYVMFRKTESRVNTDPSSPR